MALFEGSLEGISGPPEVTGSLYWKLSAESLSYFKEDDKETSVGEFALKNVSELKVSEGSDGFEFSAQGQAVRLKAATTQGNTDWVDAITKAIPVAATAQPKPPTKRVSMAGEGKKAGGTTPRRESRASGVILGDAQDLEPSSLLQIMQDLVQVKGLRVVDLFRNPQYNPSFLQTHDEELDAEELSGVLLKAGVNVTRKSCAELIKKMHGDPTIKNIGIKDLEVALRAHKRGKEIWEIRDEMPQEVKKAAKDWKRRSMTDAEMKGPKWAAPTLEAIAKLMDEKQLRIADLFRHPHYNPSYLETGDESLDAKEIHRIMKKAGLELERADIQNMIDCIDEDGSGSLEIQELEVAMRKFRRGTLIWNIPKPKKQLVLKLEYLYDLHRRHEEKLQRLANQKDMDLKSEDAKIKQEVEENRIGSRAKLNPNDYNGDQCRENLHQLHKENEIRRANLVKKAEAEDLQKLESTRIRPKRSASEPAVQREIAARNGSHPNIGHRLHAVRDAKEAERKRIREDEEVRLLMETDRISQEIIARRGNVTGNRHDQLHQDSVDRKDRRKKLRWMHLEAEASRHANKAIGKDRAGLHPQRDFKRIMEMYIEGEHRLRKQKDNQAKQESATAKAMENAVAENKRLFKSKAFKGVESKWAETLDEAPPPMAIRPEYKLGFGCRSPRGEISRPPSAWTMDPVDHALSFVNTTVALRCNCTPDESQFEVLQDLIEPLTLAMQEYKEAAEESSMHSEGAEYLRQTLSRRLFADGHLMEDPAGWHSCCEADKIRQIEDDFDVLFEQASRAQAALLAAVGPGESHADAAKIGKRWPKGAKWNHPAATKKCQFAVNPGMKSRAAAKQKAFVRFGPSEGENRHWHLLDLARVCMVFVDATLLRAGLDQIIDKFEVVDVRNHYHPSQANLLGEQYVEVIVVMKIPEPFLCEIRLEEYPFFIARQKALPHLDKIGETMAQLYTGNGGDPPAIAYLAKWILFQPKESQHLRVFKKHLAHRHGSTVVAWRKAFGGENQVPYNTFRQVSQEVGQRHRCSEFWQMMDPTRAGCISLFEFDPEAVILLIKFYWRIIGIATAEQLADPEALFERLTSHRVVKLNHPGRIEAQEFRRVTKILGFNHLDSDKMFEYLDSHGGSSQKPPATLTPGDIFWLKRLPDLVAIDCVMLKDPNASSELESLRRMTYSGRVFADQGTRARTPAAMTRQSISRGSVRASQVFMRKSISQDPGVVSASARGSRVSRSSRAGGMLNVEGLSAPNTPRASSAKRASKSSQGGSPQAATAPSTPRGGADDQSTSPSPSMSPSPSPGADSSTAASPKPSDSESRSPSPSPGGASDFIRADTTDDDKSRAGDDGDDSDGSAVF